MNRSPAVFALGLWALVLLAVACTASTSVAPAARSAATAGEVGPTAPPASSGAPLAAAPSPEPERIRIGLPATTLAHLPIYAAQAIGAFDRQGLDVEITIVRPPLQMAALQNDEVQCITTTGVPLAGALAGYEVKIVGVALPGPLFQFVTRPEITSVQGLRDKRLGTNSIGSTDHQIVTAVLRKYGLEEVVTVLGLGDTPVVAESLKSGGIDAASMSPPWPAKLRREGYPILLNVSAELEIPQAGLATSVQRLEQHREQVERVLRAEMEAIRYLQAHRAETIRIIAQTFDMDDATAEEAYDSAVGSFDARMRPSEAGIFNLATEVLASAGQTRSLAAAELYAGVVDARPVEAVLVDPGPR